MRERVESPLRPAVPDSRTPLPRLRELSGWEEEYVERHAAETNTARLCNEVLARCLVPPGAPLDEARETVRGLLVAERDHELVALRRLSLGPDVNAQVPCPECGEVSEAAFSLDELPLEFDPPPRQLTLQLEGVGPVVLRLPTAGDQEDLLDAGLEGDAERRSWLLGRCLVRYGDRRDGFDTDFARALPVRTRAKLESALEDALPDITLEMAVECSHCGASFAAPFDVGEFFFSS
jgi:hypothetical protein